MAIPSKKWKGEDTFLRSIHHGFRWKKYFYKFRSASSYNTGKSHKLGAFQQLVLKLDPTSQSYSKLCLQPTLCLWMSPKHIPTQVKHLPTTSYCIFYPPLILQPISGIFYLVHSLNEKNVTMELQVLREVTNRKRSIYSSRGVYFALFYFIFFEVEMMQ